MFAFASTEMRRLAIFLRTIVYIRKCAGQSLMSLMRLMNLTGPVVKCRDIFITMIMTGMRAS